MKTIHRFALKFIGDTVVTLPKYAEILSVTMHPSGQPMLYAIVEQGEPATVPIIIRGVMTGEDFTMEELSSNGDIDFLATLNSGQFVSHFFYTKDVE